MCTYVFPYRHALFASLKFRQHSDVIYNQSGLVHDLSSLAFLNLLLIIIFSVVSSMGFFTFVASKLCIQVTPLLL